MRQISQWTNNDCLFLQQDEYSCEYGEYCHNRPQTIKKNSRDKRYDAGDKFGMLQAMVEFALKRDDLGPMFREYLKGLVIYVE